MKTTLIDYTGKGRADERWHAAHMLIFTKQTRLNMTPDAFEAVRSMTLDKLKDELAYMAATIPSSWEFVDLTFLVEGVSRAAAQQMTRTRTASYAMQSQRVTDVGSAEVYNPCEERYQAQAFAQEANAAINGYNRLVSGGMALQDARGVLPMNITTNIVCKYNLRSFVDLVRARESLRTQGEYADIVQAMKEQAMMAWPWAATFFEPPHAKAIGLLEDAVAELGFETGKGVGWQIAKAIDLLRKS